MASMGSLLLGVAAFLVTAPALADDGPDADYIRLRTVAISVQYYDGQEWKPADKGLGSGFLIHPDGFVLTARHLAPEEFVNDPKKRHNVRVLGRIGDRSSAEGELRIIDVHLQLDAMLLKLHREADSKPFEYFELTDKFTLPLLHVFAAGFPALSGGPLRIISAHMTSDVIEGKKSGEVNAKLEGGFSGGPVLSVSERKVVGLIETSSTHERSNTYNFVPIPSIKGWLSESIILPRPNSGAAVYCATRYEPLAENRQQLSPNKANIIDYNSVDPSIEQFNPDKALEVTTGSDWRVRVNAPGLYSVSASCALDKEVDTLTLALFKNEEFVRALDVRQNYEHNKMAHGTCELPLRAGDRIDIRVTPAVREPDAEVRLATASTDTISIRYVGPLPDVQKAVAGRPGFGAAVCYRTGYEPLAENRQLLSPNEANIIDYNSVDRLIEQFNPDNALEVTTGSDWRVRVNATGFYSIIASCALDKEVDALKLELFKNERFVRALDVRPKYVHNSMVQGTCELPLVAGDRIDIRVRPIVPKPEAEIRLATASTDTISIRYVRSLSAAR
jgi:hypothetical protein